MKIAFFFGSMGRGGAERVISTLANEFIKLNDEIIIVTADNSPSGYWLDERVRLIHINNAGVSRNAAEAVHRNIRSIRCMRSILKKEKPEVVVSFELRMAVFLVLAFPFKRRFRLIASERANPAYAERGRTEEALLNMFLPKVDGFIFQTELVKEKYPAVLQMKGVVIPNGVFPEDIPAKLPSFESRKHNSLCAVGRLSWQKGYDVMIDAFQMFHDSHPEHYLHIYGEGPDREALKQQIERCELEDSVILEGNVPDVVQRIADNGMFILASRYEGMPNALMEAMACGLPCVAADCDFGPSELIDNGINGVLVPVDDAKALASAMTNIADDLSFANMLSENAAAIMDTNGKEEITMKYHSFIKQLVQRRK